AEHVSLAHPKETARRHRCGADHGDKEAPKLMKMAQYLRASVVVFLALATLAGACARPGSSQPGDGEKVAPLGPKVLRIGMYEGEPQTGIALFGGSLVFNRGGIGAPEHAYTFHAGLTVFNERGELTPWIAQKVPTLEDGDWQVLPDGQMELTWKLRPEVKWHDGTPA